MPADDSPRTCPCSTFHCLARQPHYNLYADRGCQLLVAFRTPRRFENTGDIESCFSDVAGHLALIPRHEYSLLVDVRKGPARNDDTFETTIKRERGKLLFGFARNVALVATIAGKLQVQRFAKADGREVYVTDDIEAAFGYLGLPRHGWPTEG